MKMNRDNKTIESRLPIVLAAAGFVCSLITLSVYMRSLTARTTVEARQFQHLLEDFPATGLALILSSLAVITASRWSKIFRISLGGFAVACVISLTLSLFFSLSAIFCCLTLILASMRIPRSIKAQGALMLFGFFVGMFIRANFQPSTRSMVSRVQADIRSLSVAVESYRVDYNAFPVSTTNTAQRLMWKSDSAMPSFIRYWPGGPHSLTTPIAYQSDMTDPLCYLSEKRTYAYYCAPNGQRYVVISAGVNCVFDLKPEDLDELASNPLKFVNYQYDPTNGTMSAGDIFRVEPR